VWESPESGAKDREAAFLAFKKRLKNKDGNHMKAESFQLKHSHVRGGGCSFPERHLAAGIGKLSIARQFKHLAGCEMSPTRSISRKNFSQQGKMLGAIPPTQALISNFVNNN